MAKEARTTKDSNGTEKLQLDPICGKRLEMKSTHTTEYKQRRYYFCSEGCKHRFHERTEWFKVNELARAGALLTPGKVRWGLS